MYRSYFVFFVFFVLYCRPWRNERWSAALEWGLEFYALKRFHEVTPFGFFLFPSFFFLFYLFLFHSGPMNRLVGCCRSKRSAWWGVSAGFAFQKLLPIGRWGPSITTNQDMLGRQLVFLKWGKSKLAPHVRNLIDSIAISHLQFFTKTSFCLLPNAEELPKSLPGFLPLLCRATAISPFGLNFRRWDKNLRLLYGQ